LAFLDVVWRFYFSFGLYPFISFLAFFLAFLRLVWLSQKKIGVFAFFWLFWPISTENVLIKKVQIQKKYQKK
jgi:4-amino-4-deoxy-L-arabinose transferase-like glycosyltransferase